MGPGAEAPCIVIPAGPIVSPLDGRAATDNRDSLAKMVYSRMFDWLVQKINAAIGQDPDALAIVGVLDIYGDLRLPLSPCISPLAITPARLSTSCEHAMPGKERAEDAATCRL